MMMDSNKKVGNDVNGATFRRGGGSASGRGGDNRATQVVNQRKPCSRRKETVVQKIKERRLQWFGHVERMEEKRLPNAALHGHVEGKRSRGRQRKTWMDNV